MKNPGAKLNAATPENSWRTHLKICASRKIQRAATTPFTFPPTQPRQQHSKWYRLPNTTAIIRLLTWARTVYRQSESGPALGQKQGGVDQAARRPQARAGIPPNIKNCGRSADQIDQNVRRPHKQPCEPFQWHPQNLTCGYQLTLHL